MKSKAPRIFIRGYGLISSLGYGAWQTFAALLAGRTIADRTAALPADITPVDLVRAVGCVAVAQHTADDPSVELAERAAREALFASGQTAGATAMILGASKGAMHVLSRAARAVDQPEKQRSLPHDAQAVTLGAHGYLTAELSRRLQIPALRHVAAACASSLTALHDARQTLLHVPEQVGSRDAATRLLVVTSEAALLPMFIMSYQRLGVLPPLTPAGYAGRPLDVSRAGFMLAELGAAVALERRSAEMEPGPGDIELLDTAVAAEADDLIRPSPSMTALRHVANRLLEGRSIDLLHPHATGTADYDAAEMQAYHRHAANIRDVYACKGALGHGLGAAGLVSLVIACMSAKAYRRPPMPWLREPIVAGISAEPREHERRNESTHAVFAAGFGGHVAGAVIRRY